MFEYQNILPADVEQQREFIETFYPAGQRGTGQQMDHDRSALASGGIQIGVLYVLSCWLFHQYSSSI